MSFGTKSTDVRCVTFKIRTSYQLLNRSTKGKILKDVAGYGPSIDTPDWLDIKMGNGLRYCQHWTLYHGKGNKSFQGLATEVSCSVKFLSPKHCRFYYSYSSEKALHRHKDVLANHHWASLEGFRASAQCMHQSLPWCATLRRLQIPRVSKQQQWLVERR